MPLCSYPTNGLVSAIAPDHHACILQLHLTSSNVFIMCILSACMPVTVSSYQHPCILLFYLTISHVCNNCTRPYPMSLTVASNQQSHRSVNLCLQAFMTETLTSGQHTYLLYSNIQPSVLSVALATDQKSSNGCYNCTGQAGLNQPAVKMVTNTCSMQIPYSVVGFICVDTLYSICFFCKFDPSIQLTFSAH